MDNNSEQSKTRPEFLLRPNFVKIVRDALDDEISTTPKTLHFLRNVGMKIWITENIETKTNISYLHMTKSRKCTFWMPTENGTLDRDRSQCP